MPEGDSLHRVAARLQVLVGALVEAESPSPRGRATGVAAAVDGRVLEAVAAIGKHLVLRFDGGLSVRSHLGMTGRWRVQPLGERYAGSPWLVLRSDAWVATQWNGPVLALGRGPVSLLGPDIITPTTGVEEIASRILLADPTRLLGEALLDQRLVSGIGNMWVAELLWVGRLSPWLRLGDVAPDQLEQALRWAHRSMRAAIDAPRPRHEAYRRAGRPCRRCGCAIASLGLGDANRIAYWCPGCQPGPAPQVGA